MLTENTATHVNSPLSDNERSLTAVAA